MASRSENYARQCLAASGLAVMDARIAYELRSDLWGSLQDCVLSFRTTLEAAHTERLVAHFNEQGPVIVLVRSRKNLAERIEYIVGQPVFRLELATPELPRAVQADPLRQEVARRDDERMGRLHELAAEELPNYDGPRLREILEARRELGLSE